MKKIEEMIKTEEKKHQDLSKELRIRQEEKDKWKMKAKYKRKKYKKYQHQDQKKDQFIANQLI